MTRAEDIIETPVSDPGSEPQTTPADLPSVGPKSGWRTSEGQMTFIFVAVSMVFAWLKIDVSVDTLATGWDMAMNLFQSLGPIIAAATALWAYITSRGKQKSNAINATALMAVGNPPMAQAVGLKGPWDKIISIGKMIGPAIPGPVGSIAGDILGDQTQSGVHQYNELIEVAKNHEGRIRTLESK